MLGKDKLPLTGYQPRDENYSDIQRAPIPRHRGVYLASAAMSLCVGLGLMANLLDHETGVSATATVKPGSSTNAVMEKWTMTSDIIAAQAEFTTDSNAVIGVHMQAHTVLDKIPFLGTVTGKTADIAMPDYNQKEEAQCHGKMQEIVPAEALTKTVKNNHMTLSIDMSKIEMNPYCVYTETTVDPGAKKSIDDVEAAARDGANHITSLVGIDLPKPDVIMNNITDKTKNALAAKSLQSLLKTCGPKLNTDAGKSAEQGVQQMVLKLSNFKEDQFTIKASYEHGGINWAPVPDEQIEKAKMQSITATAKLNSFNFSHESCDTTHMVVVGEKAQPKQPVAGKK